MSVQEQIRQKFNEARKERNELNRKTYESVIAKITIAEKSGKYELPLSDDIVVGLIQKEVKGVKREDRITITKSKFTNESYEDENGNKKSYFKFVIIEASINSKDDKPTSQPSKNTSKPKKEEPTPKQTADESESDPW